ncbi:hypothetical protein [Methylopila sp. Yamaguchi]|uniref:hypothetical protein n=1 Tax=Methylopila sp. Yamaguchi TaxID=1437817 RepID=UPI00190F048B|nr:hypothetical protein [Methylopila sp. Yamaguchi]
MTEKLSKIGFYPRPVDFRTVIDDRYTAQIEAGDAWREAAKANWAIANESLQLSSKRLHSTSALGHPQADLGDRSAPEAEGGMPPENGHSASLRWVLPTAVARPETRAY